MKKKTVHPKKTATKKSVHRTTRRSSTKSAEQVFLFPFSFRRIVLFSSCLLLFVFVFTLFNKKSVTQSVAGISIAKGLFVQTTVQLPSVYGASSYNIYYKEVADKKYTNAARHISASVTKYTISYLKKGTKYQYKISAADASGAEFWWSEVRYFTNLQAM